MIWPFPLFSSIFGYSKVDLNEECSAAFNYNGYFTKQPNDFINLEDDVCHVLRLCKYAQNDDMLYDDVLIETLRDRRNVTETSEDAQVLMKYITKYGGMKMKELKAVNPIKFPRQITVK